MSRDALCYFYCWHNHRPLVLVKHVSLQSWQIKTPNEHKICLLSWFSAWSNIIWNFAFLGVVLSSVQLLLQPFLEPGCHGSSFILTKRIPLWATKFTWIKHIYKHQGCDICSTRRPPRQVSCGQIDKIIFMLNGWITKLFLQISKMAAVGVDMEEKKEEEEKGEQRRGAEKAEHSLEGDFQFLPNELILPNPNEVTSSWSPNLTYFHFGTYLIFANIHSTPFLTILTLPPIGESSWHEQVKSWTCDQCTLENENANSACAACGQARKASRCLTIVIYHMSCGWCDDVIRLS